MKKYYKVWVDVDFDDFNIFEVIESEDENDKLGDYAVFNTEEEAERFAGFLQKHRRFPSKSELEEFEL